MLFNSLGFIVFFVILLLLHYSPLGWKIKKTNLLLASYLFYAAWNPPLVILLWVSTLVDWMVGNKLYVTESKLKRKGLLLISILVNLGILGFFKYGGFALDNMIYAASQYNIDFNPLKPDIILPMGISFYTFQTMSYSIDIYFKKLKPSPVFLDFALYVTFFPQLVAGPIVRAKDLIPQFQRPKLADMKTFLWGLGLLTLGLFEKIVLADTFLAAPADDVFGSMESLAFLDAWIGVLAFSGQIFFDFAGYSTCAIGIAMCLGFKLPHNFLYPYAAIGFSDLWNRWHVSLSTWLRDYLYIPLGGNRKGNMRTYANLMMTMLIGGLWHGAAWTFVAWGALHGIYLTIERLLRKRVHIANTNRFFPGFSLALLTFGCVTLTWVFFRAQSFSQAWNLLKSMFGFTVDGAKVLHTLHIFEVGIIMSLLLIIQWVMRNTTVLERAQKMNWAVIGLIWSAMLILLFIAQGSGDSFIYFQF